MTMDTERDRSVTLRVGSILRHDLPASLVVFLVAVPLSLGIAVASGAPPAAGLIAAVVGGIVAGAFGGSPLQVSGPAAGLTLIVAQIVHTYGWRAACLITVLAGLLQVVLGLLRVARAALAISPAVVHGMLAGVGAVIALAQLHIVLGGRPQGSALENLVELPAQIARNHTPAVAVGVLTIVVLALWPRLPRLRAVPAPLAALTVAAAVTWFAGWRVAHVDLGGSPGAGDAGIGDWSAPLWPRGDWHGIVAAVLLVAIVAAVESLACAVAVDRQHDGPRGDLDRELTGQGLANMVSGALGGLPVAGVIVRSTTNVRAGARTRWSGILHGAWVLLFVAGLGWTIRLIPMPALAALLVAIGVRMINPAQVRSLKGHGEIPIYAVAMGGVVVFGLAEGVLIGLGLAALMALRRLTRVSVEVSREPDGHWHLTVTGSLTFLGVPRLMETLRGIPAGVPVDAELNVDFMDHAAFEALHGWRLDHERGGGSVEIDEVHDDWYAGAAQGARVQPAKTPPRAPDRWWLPWAYRGRCLLHRRPADPSAAPATAAPAASAPARHASDTPPPPVPRVPAQAQADDAASPSAAVPRLLAGTREFHHRTAPLVRPILTCLAHRQSPSHLFITCSDSRLVPSLITSSGPGDLFIVRNIGNLVPRHHDLAAPAFPPVGAPMRPGEPGDGSIAGLAGGPIGILGAGPIGGPAEGSLAGATGGHRGGAPHDDSVGAAVEYAMEVLGVRTITVCGHSGCGAMSALLNGGVTADAMPRLWRWLRHGEATLVRSSAGAHPSAAGPLGGPADGQADEPADDPLDGLCRANVLQQLDNLLTYPSIAALVETGRLELVGLYFDIATARVHVLSHDPAGRTPVGAG